MPVEGRLEWSNRPDVVPVNWFVSEAHKTRNRLAGGQAAAAQAVAAPVVETQEFVPTYLLEEKVVRAYLMLAQNTEGPLAELNLGEDAATREGVIRFGVESWFDKPLAERADIAPNNPDDMPIEWFKNWLRWIKNHA